ncbi:MAG: LysE family translocator, partial [Tsuneonella sp.]
VVDPERLYAFALMTAATSFVPGVSMLFVMGQTMRRGWRSGAAALAGMQIGYIGWWLLAALGLGTLASAFPRVFQALAIGGALYLAWMGVQSIRRAGEGADAAPGDRKSIHAFRDGILVALGNPKSLVYIVALLPPFVDMQQPVPPQLLVLAVVSLVIDVIAGAIYIGAGRRLTAAMSDHATRRRLDIGIGLLFIAIGAGILVDIVTR